MIPTDGLKLTARMLLTLQRCGPDTMHATRKAMIAHDGIEVSRDTFGCKWRNAVKKGWLVRTGELRYVKHRSEQGLPVYTLSPTCPDPLDLRPEKRGPKAQVDKRAVGFTITKPDTLTMTEAELIAAAVAEGKVRRFGPGTAEDHGLAKKRGWARASVLRGAKAGVRAAALARVKVGARAGGC